MPASILVVEDDATVAETVREVLVDAGYLPELAASGPSALAAVARLRPALVLMDLELDGPLDGIEAARHLRELHGTRVIYLTGAADAETLRRASETWPLGYLNKPFRRHELRTAVEFALQQATLQSALAAREAWFATTLQSIGDAVLTADADERVTFLNRAAEAIIGVRATEALGKRLDDVVRLVDSRGGALPFATCRSASPGRPSALPREARLVTSDEGGSMSAMVEIEGSVAPSVSPDATSAFGSVMVFRDVGERRQLERRVGMTERLAAIGTMAAGMQHEINNPLASTMANLQFALERLRSSGEHGASGEEVRDLVTALEDASEGAERVRRTVEELRHFSQKAEDITTPTDIAGALDVAVRMTAHAVRHHATVRREYAAAPRVRAEEGQLARVFMNLLLSAAQATGDGGATRHTIVLRTRTDGSGRAVAEISDDGPGMPRDVLHRIFDPFFIAPPENTAIGLGLAISLTIVTSLGGVIDVESELGEGTTFRVSLPSAERQPLQLHRSQPPRATLRPARRGDGRRARILVVDDEAAIGRALSRMLSREHDVTVESDARQALERLRSECYDVIFCDLMMPNMSGMDFFDQLSSWAPEKAARMVFLTGGAFSPRSEEFLRAIENVCLPKPFSRDAVSAVIKTMFDPASASAQ